MSHKNIKGFTLLEVLVAVFIFTIAAVIMTSALHNVLNMQSETEAKASRLAELQMSFLMLSRDIEQALDRPITNAKNTRENAFIGTASNITLTRGGFQNPDSRLNRSTLQRIRYTMQNEQLVRVTWPVLDQVAATQPNTRSLLSSISDIRFEYLDDHGTFRHDWPPSNQSNSPPLPRGVRITLTLNHWGKITQFYLIKGQAFSG